MAVLLAGDRFADLLSRGLIMHMGALLEPAINLPRLAEILDGLGPIGRVETIRHWDARTQSRLFEAAKGVRPLSTDDFVPKDSAPLVEVIHHGHNTVPIFSNFQKRFCKPGGKDGAGAPEGELWGFNFNVVASQQWRPNEIVFPLLPFIGPGYFVARAGQAGELDIDYTRVPDGKAPGWPAVVPAQSRLGALVFRNMVDVMRGVSAHVTIGRARRGPDWLDQWFVLCREDPKP